MKKIKEINVSNPNQYLESEAYLIKDYVQYSKNRKKEVFFEYILLVILVSGIGYYMWFHLKITPITSFIGEIDINKTALFLTIILMLFTIYILRGFIKSERDIELKLSLKKLSEQINTFQLDDATAKEREDLYKKLDSNGGGGFLIIIVGFVLVLICYNFICGYIGYLLYNATEIKLLRIFITFPIIPGVMLTKYSYNTILNLNKDNPEDIKACHSKLSDIRNVLLFFCFLILIDGYLSYGTGQDSI